ncbi:hypothetical protein PLESTM_001250000 [Pleodorina starrii]|nr:hypothetical protein PLESTM_001250000 [Pleodorina starrii]
MAPTATAGAASQGAAALAVLASCNLKELHLKRADGSRILDSLHATCRAARLIPAGTPDGSPRERYLAVFDAALNGGLGCWILDYVEVVCADRHLTSNDPLEAYLLDGGFVKAWAQARLQRAEQAATSALANDASFHAFQASHLQQQLAQMRVLVSVLRSLDRIRAVAAGGTAAALAAAAAVAAGAGQDRLSVKAELRQAVLLEQAFQVMDWCCRQGLAAPGAPPGRFASCPEWVRAVAARRARAAPRPLFLDGLLQSLTLSGAYPAASIPAMLYSLLLVVPHVDPATWTSKLALLSYYLMDSGVLDAGGAAAAVGGGGVPGAGAGNGGSGGGRLEAALGDLRRTFRLSPGDVGVWQCYYLLDCASPVTHGSEDPYLARACALLPSYVTASTPFAFIEALLALGRPDVALAVDRGQLGARAGPGPGPGTAVAAAGGADAPAGALAAASTTTTATSSGRCCSSLPQAMVLLEIRLRCGLMSEAFMMLRQHTADLAAAASVSAASGDGEVPGGREALQEHTRALLRHLAGWAADADAAARAEAGAGAGDGGGGGGWLNRLTELPLNAAEEFVLVEWLTEQAEAGRPAGTFLPLFFLQRGRVSEAMAAWRRWSARQDALAAAGGAAATATPALLSGLVAAALDAAYDATLPTPLRNADVPLPPSAAAAAASASGAPVLPDLAPGQGAVSILAGLVNQASPDQPAALLPFHGTEPPPLITRVVQLPPTTFAPAAPAAPPAAAFGDEQPFSQPLFPGPAAPPPPPQQAPFAAMPLLLPSTAPFRTPPATPGFDASMWGFRPAQQQQQQQQQQQPAAGPLGNTLFGAGGGGGGAAAGGGGGGGGGLLFSVGAGAVAAEAAERPPAGAVSTAGAVSRTFKRSRPNPLP